MAQRRVDASWAPKALPPHPATVSRGGAAPAGSAPYWNQGIQRAEFKAHGIKLKSQESLEFTLAAAQIAISLSDDDRPSDLTDADSKSGVQVGDVASYKVIQYIERTGDNLTGDHQPSGAAVIEAIREQLHKALLAPLTRLQAKRAYNRAITLVVTEDWHRAQSRTYGGRNTKAQITADAANLASAAQADFTPVIQHLRDEGYTDDQIKDIWEALRESRNAFFDTGLAQAGSFS